MDVLLNFPSKALKGSFRVTGSKSESNRLLVLQALYPNIRINNLSNSDDTRVLQSALTGDHSEVDVHHAGTAMRFLTAFFASREGKEVTLTGSRRMRERPVKVLVQALQDLGASIEYLNEEGFPPLQIQGKKLVQKEVWVQANISSQYISALMLIGPSLPEGLRIHLKGRLTSAPYIAMTLGLLQKCGLTGHFQDNEIYIPSQEAVSPVEVTVESDWSSASYFYSLVALSSAAEMNLSSYRQNSLQGDNEVVQIFRKLGVETTFAEEGIILKRVAMKKPRTLCLDLTGTPDLAQTIASVCLGLGIDCELRGLHTLRIKETDRLAALKKELEKLGGSVEISLNSLNLTAPAEIKQDCSIETYNDHRMALAFAPLALKVPIRIQDAGVVSKSFPQYWECLEQLGCTVEKA